MESTADEKLEEIMGIFSSCSDEDYNILWETLKIEMEDSYGPWDSFLKNLNVHYWKTSIEILKLFKDRIKVKAIIEIVKETLNGELEDYYILSSASEVVKLDDDEKLKVINECIDIGRCINMEEFNMIKIIMNDF